MDKELRKLNQKQRRFCKYYLEDMPVAEAYVKAGYSKNGARESGTKLLQKSTIAAYIAKITAISDKNLGISRNFVLRKYMEIVENPDSQKILCTALKDISRLQGYELQKAPETPTVLIQINSETLQDKLKILKKGKDDE